MDKDLVQIRITTLTGAEYVFPDVHAPMVKNVKMQLDDTSDRLLLTNISQATLLLPTRIIKRVETREGEGFVKRGKVIWERE